MCMTVQNHNVGEATSVVPKAEWNNYLSEFSRTHQGWLTRLETADRVTKEKVESHEMSLRSIELDLEDEKHPRINVTVHIDNKDFKHILYLPSRLVVHQSEGGWRESLEIETVNTHTVVRVRPQASEF